MDDVFKALADPPPPLLDELLERDGQTLIELQGLPPMTRFGVMKHLNLLEDAGLITTRKAGREKLPPPQSGADPAALRPLGQQVRQTVGRGRSPA